MKKILFSLLTVLFLTFMGCTSTQPSLSPEQLREITTKEIEGDYKTVFKATMSVLEDQNYIIKNSNLETGLINCEKSVKKETTAGDVLMVLFVDVRHGASSNVYVSANITEVNSTKTKVRFNIQENVITRSSYGNSENANFITDKTIYDSLFNQLKIEVERMKALK